MSLLNVSLNFLAYLDAVKSANPSMRMTDQEWSLMGIPSDQVNTYPLVLSPGETKQVMSTARALNFNSSTTFAIAPIPGSCLVQLTGSFGQRTGRADGDDTTQWQVTVVNGLVTLTFAAEGTAPDFTTMRPGDGVMLGTAFQQYNQGIFQVVKVGANFIQFQNQLGVAENVTGQADVFSSGPVQVGDTLDLTSSQFSFPNQGQFQITAVTDTFVQFTNRAAVPETVTGVTGGLTIYLDSYEWMLVALDGRTILNLNGDTGSGLEVSPGQKGNIGEDPGLMLKRGKVYQMQAYNPGQDVVRGFVVLVQS